MSWTAHARTGVAVKVARFSRNTTSHVDAPHGQRKSHDVDVAFGFTTSHSLNVGHVDAISTPRTCKEEHIYVSGAETRFCTGFSEKTSTSAPTGVGSADKLFWPWAGHS